MKFKLIIAFLPDARLEEVLRAARAAGATGSTVITSARGEGLEPERRFLGLELASHRNLALWLVEAHVAADVLREIAAVGRFETERGAGIACRPAATTPAPVAQAARCRPGRRRRPGVAAFSPCGLAAEVRPRCPGWPAPWPGRAAPAGRVPLATGISSLTSFSICCSSPASSGVQKAMAIPSRPARAVRPMRCT